LLQKINKDKKEKENWRSRENEKMGRQKRRL